MTYIGSKISDFLNTQGDLLDRDPNKKPPTANQFTRNGLNWVEYTMVALIVLAFNCITDERCRHYVSKSAVSLYTKSGLCLSQSCQNSYTFDAAVDAKNLTAIFALIGNYQFIKPKGWGQKVAELVLASPEDKKIENVFKFFKLTQGDNSEELCEHQLSLYDKLIKQQGATTPFSEKYPNRRIIGSVKVGELSKSDQCSFLKFAFCMTKNKNKIPPYVLPPIK